MASESIGDAYLDHFYGVMGDPIAREVFEEGSQNLFQILVFKNVFPECLVFCSFGVSRFPDRVGHIVELVVVADEMFDKVILQMATALRTAIRKGLRLEEGVAFSGLSRIDPEFARRTGKEALYVPSSVQGFPDSFAKVALQDGGEATVLLGMLISDREFKLWEAKGAQALEDALERAEVDPFSVFRPSAV